MEKFTLSQVKNILICEDHPFIQMGIEVALKGLLPKECSFKIANCGEDAIKTASNTRLDLAFVDLGLPGISGVEVIKELKILAPTTKVLVVTSCDNPSTLKDVESLSPSAIIQKSSSGEHLQHALAHLENVSVGAYFDPKTRSLLSEYREIQFTAREQEVLGEIVQGYSNQKIADRLGCAVTTVRFHRANILGKTGMKNAAELTAWYLQGQRKRD